MALYTGAGDGGDSGLFGSVKRLRKDSAVFEALGALDEVNTYLGLCRVVADVPTGELLESVQQNLFVVQAQLAGADKRLAGDAVASLERVVDAIEKELPPITTFFLAGGSECAARIDYARTLARRAERRVVSVQNAAAMCTESLAYMNRLSSLLYALSRREQHRSGNESVPPAY